MKRSKINNFIISGSNEDSKRYTTQHDIFLSQRKTKHNYYRNPKGKNVTGNKIF